MSSDVDDMEVADTPVPGTPERETSRSDTPGPDTPGPDTPGPDTFVPDVSGSAASRAPARWTVVAGIVALLVVLAGSGMLFRTHQLRDAPTARNQALTDTARTSRVIGDVSSALGKVLSYTPQDTGVTEQAAHELLAGKAAKQYAALFGQVGKRAKQQKLTLTTQVVRAGVTRLTGSEARLLVFLDQTAQRKGKAAGVVAAQLAVTAELRDGSWLITDITAR